MNELSLGYYFENIDIFPLKNLFNVVNVWDALKKKEIFLEDIGNEINGVADSESMLKGNIFVGAGSVVEYGTVIKGPVYIGKNCRIGPQAYIRPGTVICDNAEIGRAEVKGSIIFPGVKAHHVSYIGDSIVGSKTNIAVGTQMLNVRHDSKNVTINFGGQCHQTGLKKFGAVIGDGCKIGGNCVLNPGTLVGQNCWIYPNVLLKGFYPSNRIIKSTFKITHME
jgi:bifunctional UDP-N-acetylglucosamine pyrophosphorylase/glucosamine-1-phosphate N-acetyltransferase